jgi:hypothetical protein
VVVDAGDNELVDAEFDVDRRKCKIESIRSQTWPAYILLQELSPSSCPQHPSHDQTPYVYGVLTAGNMAGIKSLLSEPCTANTS